jgi:hypothetical protein
MEKNTKIIIAVLVIILGLILLLRNGNFERFQISNPTTEVVCDTDSDCSDGTNVTVKCMNPRTIASLCLAPGEGISLEN